MAIEWLICLEPVHIGGSDSSSRGNNNPIFRLPDRTPAIPGSSLRGALREHAENLAKSQTNKSENEQQLELIKNWFGSENERTGDDISPGYISLGWGWPLWWPIHVLGYGNWWVSCPSWLDRFGQLSGKSMAIPDRERVHITEPQLHNKTVYLRWLKLNNVQKFSADNLPYPENLPILNDLKKRRIIVPDSTINMLVDMGLVRQPRVNLLNDPNLDRENYLFSVEGYPPGAVFITTWTIRDEKKVKSVEAWKKFLAGEHYLGGLWSVGYGRILISPIAN